MTTIVIQGAASAEEVPGIAAIAEGETDPEGGTPATPASHQQGHQLTTRKVTYTL